MAETSPAMTMWKPERPKRQRHVRCPATSRRGERNALMAVIKPDFIAPNMISAGFSSVCGLAKNARCT